MPGSPLTGIRPPAASPRPAKPAVAMDPRISARRLAVQAQEARRRYRRLIWLGGVVGAAVAVVGATRTPLLDVDHIEVSGVDGATAAEVAATLDAAGLHHGDPIVDVDLGVVGRALEALPGVTDARLLRRWPGTIEVDVVERIPVAAVAGAGGSALVGEDGVVVDVVDPATAASRAVAVAGPTDLAAGDRFDEPELLAVAAALPEPLRAAVALVAPAEAGEDEVAVELHLAAGGVIRLGATEQLPTKLVAAATMLTQVDTSCLAVLDVRVPSSPAVTRDPTC